MNPGGEVAPAGHTRTASDGPTEPEGARHRAARGSLLFATPVDAARPRRATDVILLVSAAAGSLLLGLAALPPAGFERAVAAFLASLPRALVGFWQLTGDLLALVAIALALVAVARRRWTVLLDLVLAGVVAFAATVALGRVVQGSWPQLRGALAAAAEPGPWSSALRLAVAGAVVMAAAPHTSRAARRAGRWLVLLATFAVAALGAASPSEATTGLLLAVVGAAAVHVAFGSPSGRPSLEDVVRALDDLGVRPRRLGAATRQRSGLFVVDAVAEGGEALVVKVYGRDAYDTQLLSSLWRAIWYRDAGTPISVGRLQQAEHEALLTMLAQQAGVPAPGVRTVGASAQEDVLLVLEPLGLPLAERPDRWSAAVAADLWATLGVLHDAGITHGQLDDRAVVLGRPPSGEPPGGEPPGGEGADAEGRVGLVDFRGAVVARPDGALTDRAQALVTTVLGLGEGPALDVALGALGPGGLAAVLPFLQSPSLTHAQRRQARAVGLDIDGLRERAAALAGEEAPALQQLRRVRWRSLVQVALLVFAFLALASGLAGLDFDSLLEELADAAWWLVAVGFVVAQLPRFAQAVSSLGASPVPIPLGPLYALQLAVSYINLAVPSSAARIAVGTRFFQRHGLPPGSALAVGAIDSLGGFAVQMALLAGLLLSSQASLDLRLDSTPTSGLARLATAVVLAGVVAAAVLALVGRWRRPILARARQLVSDALTAVKGLGSPRRLAMLLGGNLASELLFATAIGAITRAFGYPVGLSELLLINVAVALLAGLLPIPGGIGVVEGGLTLGLVAAGMPEETAFAAALSYRLATFYLPPIWGFVALRWLERNDHL